MPLRQLLACACLLLAPAPLVSQETAPPISSPADFTEAGMAARLAAILPALEHFLDYRFEAPVAVRAASVEQMMAIILEEEALGARRHSGAGREDAFDPAMAFGQARRTLAKVDCARGVIHVLADAFESGSGGAIPQHELDLVLLHEAVHVYQDRRFGLSRLFGRCRAPRETRCLQAVLEGHAEWVTAAAAGDAGIPPEALDRHRRRREPAKDAGLIDRWLARVADFPYSTGERFVAAAVAALGQDSATRRIFASPPTTLAHLEDPEGYLEVGGAAWDADSQRPVALTSLPLSVRFATAGGEPVARVSVHLWPEDAELPIVVAHGPPSNLVAKVAAGADYRIGLVFADGVPHVGLIGERIPSRPGRRIQLELLGPGLCAPKGPSEDPEPDVVIEVPREWGSVRDLSAWLERPERGRRVRLPLDLLAIEGMAFSFRAPPHLPGPYELVVPALDFRELISLRPGLRPVRIRAGTPVDLVIEPLDSETGEILRGRPVQWALAPPGRATAFYDAIPSARDGRFRIRAGRGVQELMLKVDGYVLERRVLDLSGLQAATEVVALRPAGDLSIELTGPKDDAPGGTVSIEHEAGLEQRSEALAPGVTTARFDDLEPGRYRVTVDPPDGYDVAATPSVVVRPRAHKTLQLALVQRP